MLIGYARISTYDQSLSPQSLFGKGEGYPFCGVLWRTRRTYLIALFGSNASKN